MGDRERNTYSFESMLQMLTVFSSVIENCVEAMTIKIKGHTLSKLKKSLSSVEI